MTKLMKSRRVENWGYFFAGIATVAAGTAFGSLRGMVRPLVDIAAPVTSATLQSATRL